MRPKAITDLFNMLAAPTKESWHLAGCPTLIARPHSQPAVTQLYYSSREGSSVSVPRTKIEFCCSRKGMKLLPGTGYVWHAPFHPCTHPPTHPIVLVSFLAQFPSSATSPLPGVIHPPLLGQAPSPLLQPLLRCLLHLLFWPKQPCNTP